MLSLPCSQVEKHWTEKSRAEMTERDWRIFREDFNISYRGHNPTLPIRNWDEADLPGPLRKVLWEVSISSGTANYSMALHSFGTLCSAC